MTRHRHYATTEVYVEEVQRLLEGAEDAVTQIGAQDVARVRPINDAVVLDDWSRVFCWEGVIPLTGFSFH